MTPRTLLALLLSLTAAPRADALERVQTSGPARLEVRTAGAGDALALSDTVTATVTVEGGPGLEVEPADPPAAATWAVLRREPAETTALPAGRVRWRQTVELAPLARGKLALDPPALRYREADGDWQAVTWRPVEMTVTSQIAQPESARLRDITLIEDVPPAPDPARWPGLLLLAVPAALALGLGLAVWRRRRRRGRPRQPARDALRQLDRLEGRARGERFVTVLSLILRRYLERQFQVPARRRTTAELVQALAAADPFTAEQRAFLEGFLRRADLVKFGGANLSAEECQALAAEVRRFIQNSA